MPVPYAPAMPMVGRFTRKIFACLYQKKCIKMYIETLCVIAKKWKQPKCPSRALLLEKVNSIFYNEIQFKIESECTTDKHIYMEEYKNHKAG